MYGKGGFWINGSGFFTLKQVRTHYGIVPEPRKRRERVTAYGDYATIAAINGVKP